MGSGFMVIDVVPTNCLVGRFKLLFVWIFKGSKPGTKNKLKSLQMPSYFYALLFDNNFILDKRL